MNIITLIGRVGGDPDYRSFPTGGAVISFSLATSEKWTSKDGEKKEKTQWHKVVIKQEGLIRIVQGYVKKGALVAIVGQLEYRQWEKDGVKRSEAEIIMGPTSKLSLLSSQKDDADEPAPKAGKKSFADDLDDDSEIPF